MNGIIAVGGYLPQLRLDRKAYARDLAWSGLPMARTSDHANSRQAAARAYAAAGIANPGAQLDMTEVHDCFSITELVIMEDLACPTTAARRTIFSMDGTMPMARCPANSTVD